MAGLLLQESELFDGFHALGNQVQAQVAAHRDNRPDDLGVIAVLGAVTNKRLIDFQQIQR